ncbi:MAG: hypothetical protein U7123_18080 [Potamolinea sp.]
MSQQKNRKPLDDVLAQQFIYGGKQQDTLQEPALEQTASESTPTQTSSKNSKRVTARESSQTTKKIFKSDNESAVIPEELTGVTVKQPKQSPLMNKFQTPPKEATVRFTVDLPQSIHRKLSILAARTGQKKADIVRVLLNEALHTLNE